MEGEGRAADLSVGVQSEIGPPLVVRIGGREYQVGAAPHARQAIFLNAGEREQLYGGAKRGGKSVGLCQKLIMLAVTFPGNRLGLLRKDLTDLRESTLVTFERVCPPELIINHHRTFHNYVIRTNGQPSIIHYDGLGEASDIESVKGWEFGAFAIDEPSEIDVETYRMLLAQLCWVLPDGRRPPYMALLGSNPEPGWVEERFGELIAPTEDDQTLTHVSDGKRVFVKALPRDNPYLPPDWEKDAAMDAPVEWVKKYIGGSWKVSTGQVYKEFDDDLHGLGMMPDSQYLAGCKLYGSLDHATTGITAFEIVAADADDNLVSILEYYQKNRLVSEHSKEIKLLMDRAAMLCGKTQKIEQSYRELGVHPSFYAFEYILIDPSTQAKTLQNRTDMWSIQDEYRRNGLPTIPAINAMEPGINLVSEYLHPKPMHLHPITGKRGAPSYFVVKKECPNVVREFIQWRKTISDRGTIKYIGPDHAIDNIRYICNSRPEPPALTSRDTLTLDSLTQMKMRTHGAWGKKFDPKETSNVWFR